MTGKAWRLAGVVLSLLPLAATAEDRLTPVLRHVPADSVAGGPLASLQFFDLAAMREAQSVLLAEEAGGDDLAERVDVLTASRMAWYLGPAFLGDQGVVARFMPEYFGFPWRDVTVVAAFGPPPDQSLMIAAGPGVISAERLGPLLTTREFEPYQAEERDGRTVWWRFEDLSSNPRLRDPADPFWGRIGGGARIAAVDGAMVGARTWAGLDRVLAAATGDAPSLAGSADFLALAHALDQPVEAEGDLLQATLVDGRFDLAYLQDVWRSPPERHEDYLADTHWGTPPYDAVAVADRQEGPAAIAIVALAYTTRAEAETAAATVTTAIADGRGPDDVPFADALPYRLVSDVIEGPDGSRFVARIAFVEVLEAAPQSRRDAGYGPYRALATLVARGGIAGLLAVGG